MGRPKKSTYAPADGGAKVPGTEVMSVKDHMRQEIDTIQSRIQTLQSSKIEVTKQKLFIFPDRQESAGPISVVVLDFINMNVWYDRPFPTTRQPGDRSSPACFALGYEINDRLKPDASSPNQQSENCEECELNQFGSKGDGKACSNRVNLAVLAPDDEAKPGDILLLSLSPTAIRAWSNYVSSLASVFGVAPIGVITEIGFDPKVDYSSLRFGKPTMLNEEAISYFLGRQQEARTILERKPDTSAYEPPSTRKPKTR